MVTGCNQPVKSLLQTSCYEIIVLYIILLADAAIQPLGRIALGTQRHIVIKLSRGQSVGLCVSAFWKNSGSDPDAVWHHRSDRSRDEAGSGVWGSVLWKGVLLGANLGRAIVTNGDFTAYVCNSATTRPSSQITFGRLVPSAYQSLSTYLS